jgi:hypothetical protein
VHYERREEREGEGRGEAERGGDVKERERRGEEGGESEIECIVWTHVDQRVRMVMRTPQQIFREQPQSFLRTVIYAFPELPSFLSVHICSVLYCGYSTALTRVMKLNSAGAVSASLLLLKRPGGASLVLSAGNMSVSASAHLPAGEVAVRNLQSIFFALVGSFMTGRQRFSSTEVWRGGKVMMSGCRGGKNECDG